jgi:hypothetical protein
LLDELEASRASRKNAWRILQELRAVVKDVCKVELPPPAVKNISVERKVVKDGAGRLCCLCLGCSFAHCREAREIAWAEKSFWQDFWQ